MWKNKMWITSPEIFIFIFCGKVLFIHNFYVYKKSFIFNGKFHFST